MSETTARTGADGTLTWEQPERQSPTIGALAGALAKAQGKITPALKDSDNPFFKSRYADLSSVWEAIRGPLSENGLAVIQTTDLTTEGVLIITTLAHESGEWMRGWLRLLPAKSDPQGIGSAITYGRRYTLSAIVGVAPDDDDGEGAIDRDAKPSSRPSREPARAQRATSAQQPAPEKPAQPAASAEEKAFQDDQLPSLATWRDAIVHFKCSLRDRKLGDLQLAQLGVLKARWIDTVDWTSSNPIYYTKQDLHLKAAVLLGISELEKPAETAPPAEIKPTREYLLAKVRELMAEATMSQGELMSYLLTGKQCVEDAKKLTDIPDDDLELYIAEWPKLLEAWGAVPSKKKGAKK